VIPFEVRKLHFVKLKYLSCSNDPSLTKVIPHVFMRCHYSKIYTIYHKIYAIYFKADMCPTEGARVPDKEREWPNRGHDGCPTKGRVSGGGPTEEYINDRTLSFGHFPSAPNLTY
jgi:hypothetical protein